MDKKALIEKLVKEAYEKELFTGTWLYAENGEIVSKGAVGFSDPDCKQPIREDSIFDIGSISKHITCTAVMLLRRQGLLDLDDDITEFFPVIPYKGITIRNLMTHTSGLPDYLAWVTRTAKKENTIPDNSIIIRFLAESGDKVLFAPGEGWSYCNTGYCLLAEIVAKAAGIPFADFLKKNIFEPAGMSSTALLHQFKDGPVDNMVQGFTYGENGYTLSEHSMFRDLVLRADGSEGDGFVKTNIFDMLTWDRAQREGKVLTKEEQELMYTPAHLNDGRVAGRNYGFGWGINEVPGFGRTARHLGGWPGYRSCYVRYLDTDRVLIYLCSRDTMDEWGMGLFTEGLMNIAADAEPKPLLLLEDMAVRDPDRSGWDAYCGTYEGDGLGLALEKVFRKGDDLYGEFYNTEADVRHELRLYPLEDSKFAVKQDTGKLEFGDGCVTVGDTVYKKVQS